MRKMLIYRYNKSYGDGIVLIDKKTAKENILKSHKDEYTWKYIGKQLFSEKILRKLDIEKTLDTYGEIDLSYFE